MRNRNVIRATLVYLVFFTLLATEHVFEHSYAATILGFDETNLIDLNWYVLAGILVGVAFTYFTFARRKWRYKTMAKIVTLLGSQLTDFNAAAMGRPLGELIGMVEGQALVVSMKEIYGWLLIVGISAFLCTLAIGSTLRPWAIFPKWRTIRRGLRHLVRLERADE